MALTVGEIEDDLRGAVAGIDPSTPGAAREVWRAFLEHAAKPIIQDSPPHPD